MLVPLPIPAAGGQRSDAWFLTALAKCDGGPAPLACVIGWGDAINHAIFNRGELNGALDRLGHAGYVTRYDDGTIELTEAGRSLVTEARKVGTLHGWVDEIERLLGEAPAYDPRSAGDGEDGLISEAEYMAAVDRYRAEGIT
jgi:hypothetical protein